MAKKQRRGRRNRQRVQPPYTLSQKTKKGASQEAVQARGLKKNLFRLCAVCVPFLLTLGLGLPPLLPSIDINPGGTYELVSLYSTPFSITNNGVLSIYNANVVCRVHNLDYDYRPKLTGGGGIRTPEMETKALRPRDTFDIICPFGLDVNVHIAGVLTRADIEIITEFRPAWSPFTQVKCARFVTNRDFNGRLRWLKRPSSDCAWPFPIITFEAKNPAVH